MLTAMGRCRASTERIPYARVKRPVWPLDKVAPGEALDRREHFLSDWSEVVL